MKPIKRLADWWRVHFLGAELGVALALGAAFAAWELALGGARVSDPLLRGNRAEVYGALASLWGSLLGFTLAAVAIALGLATGDRLAVVRDSRHYATLWRIFIAAMRALALATLAALAGLVADRDAAPVHALLCLAVAAALVAALRVARTIWVFERLIALVTAQSKSSGTPRGPG